jgi:hypothetical protein
MNHLIHLYLRNQMSEISLKGLLHLMFQMKLSFLKNLKYQHFLMMLK